MAGTRKDIQKRGSWLQHFVQEGDTVMSFKQGCSLTVHKAEIAILEVRSNLI
jgi:hypothetical protein